MAVDDVIGDVVYAYMRVYGLTRLLHNPGGVPHPDPGGWMSGALMRAVDELAVEIEAISNFYVLNRPERAA